jgi:hypothetical protein
MAWDYNESLLEGLAWLGTLANTSITTGGSTSFGTFRAISLRRVVFDIMQAGASGTTSGHQIAVTLQAATTSGAAFFNLPGPGPYPTLTQGMFTPASAGATNYRFEYKAETIRAALDASATPTATWLRLSIAAGNTGSTIACSGVAYGVMGNAPSADVTINGFAITPTTPVVPVGNQYMDGTVLTNTSAFPIKVLPY